MTERLRELGLVDENGNVDASRLRSLGRVLQGMDPDTMRTVLGCLGYDMVAPASTVTGRDGRTRNDRDGGSEIWRREDPDGRTVHHVRIDEYGHDPPPGESERTWVDSNPHYHVSTTDSSQSASSISDTPRRDGTVPRDVERSRGTQMNDNGVPVDESGQPLSQDRNFEQRYEPGAVTYDLDGNPSRNPRDTHHFFPGSQYEG